MSKLRYRIRTLRRAFSKLSWSVDRGPGPRPEWDRGWSVKRPLLWALARVIWSGTVGGRAAVVCAPFPKLRRWWRRPGLCLSPWPTSRASRGASEKEHRSCAPFSPRERGRVEFTPQAGQPNGNKKLRQTALPTPRRPVNIAATTSAGCGDKVVVVADGAGRLASPLLFLRGSQRETLRWVPTSHRHAVGRWDLPFWRKLFATQLLKRISDSTSWNILKHSNGNVTEINNL